VDDTAKDARFWDRISQKYASSPVADQDAYERTLDHTRQFLRNTDSIFEFGCGSGGTALVLAPFVAPVLASDISPEMIKIARDKARAQDCGNVRFETGAMGAAGEQEHRTAAFDAVLAFNVLHLIPDRSSALRHVHALLKGGGHFISTTPCLGDMNPFAAAAMRVVVAAMRLGGARRGFVSSVPACLNGRSSKRASGSSKSPITDLPAAIIAPSSLRKRCDWPDRRSFLAQLWC